MMGLAFFTIVSNAAGAAGTSEGRADTVTVADYDNDGFMDVLVSNGLGDLPIGFGPTQLFKNTGNANNWLHLDLRGISSNRDGIGAWVELTAGSVSQSGLQDNGVKRYGQDDQRMHFGLADNLIVDAITITWPSGVVQALSNVSANQVLTIVEEIDSDNDSIFDEYDNCLEAPNPLQIDADSDGFGNVCDTDLNNDGITNFIDFQLFAVQFLSSDPVADFDGDGVVNFIDLSVIADYFLLPPGPLLDF